jgi:hypothetical protein
MTTVQRLRQIQCMGVERLAAPPTLFLHRSASTCCRAPDRSQFSGLRFIIFSWRDKFPRADVPHP